METLTDDKPTGKQLRDITRSQTIAEGLLEKKTWTEISQELGISRQHLYAELRENPELKSLVIAEITEWETQLKNWIDNNINANNPANQRAAITELGKMIRHAKDKAYPTIFRHENININIDLTRLQQQNEIHLETISRMPPNMRQLYIQINNQIRQEWNLNTPTQPP